MWIEVSEGNWLNVAKVGRVWIALPRTTLDDYSLCATVDGEFNVILTVDTLSEAQAKVRAIVGMCQEFTDGRETWKQVDAAPARPPIDELLSCGCTVTKGWRCPVHDDP